MTKYIIGLVGEFASGKGEAAKYIKKKYNGKVLTFSDPLNDILNRIGKTKIRDNQSALANSLRKSFGEDILSQVLMQDAEGQKSKIIIIDGFRKIGELKFFRKYTNFYLINIKADIETRYQRIIRRGEKIDEKTKTLEDFKKDHKLAADIDITKVGNQADYSIDNSGTKKEFYKAIDNTLKLIIKK